MGSLTATDAPVPARPQSWNLATSVPFVGVDRATFLKSGYIPPNLENTLVAEEDFAQGQPVAPLSPADDQVWQDEWARFKAGA